MECPIMMGANSNKDKECRRQYCSWWITKGNCCAVIAMYRVVTKGLKYDIVAKSDAEAG